MNEVNGGGLLQEMQWVRKLLMLQVLASGYQQKDMKKYYTTSPTALQSTSCFPSLTSFSMRCFKMLANGMVCPA